MKILKWPLLTAFLLAFFSYRSDAQCQAVKQYCYPSSMELVNGKIMFLGGNDPYKCLPWISDGTTGGTMQIQPLAGTLGGYKYGGGRVLGNEYFFFGDDGNNGLELWKTDGTPAGTKMVKNIMPGASGYYGQFCSKEPVNGKIFFVANDGNGFQFWTTDGTDAGTVKVSNLAGITNQSMPYTFGTVNNKLVFIYGNRQLYVSDGTVAGTGPMQGIDNVYSSFMMPLKGKLYFFRVINKTAELWYTDGKLSGTKKLANTAFADMYWTGTANMYTADENQIYFEGAPTTGSGGSGWSSELWRTDGTDTGTYKIRYFHSYLHNMQLVNGIVYFTAYDNDQSKGLWRSDGTEQGTWLVKNMNFGFTGGDAHGTACFYDFNDTLFFNSLWQSDGTGSGTKELCTLGYTIQFISYNKRLYFATGTDLMRYGSAPVTGLNELTVNSRFQLYPNPASAEITVINEENQQKKLLLYNINGQLVMEQELSKGMHTIDVSALAKGVYLCTVRSADGREAHTKVMLK